MLKTTEVRPESLRNRRWNVSIKTSGNLFKQSHSKRKKYLWL